MTEQIIKECRKIVYEARDEISNGKDVYLLNLRLKALDRMNRDVQNLAKCGFGEKIVLGIARKKAALIMRLVCDSEADLILSEPCPRYDGEKYVSGVPEEYFVPEEEIVYWTTLSTLRVLGGEENRRLAEVSAMIFPAEAREIAGETKERI